MSLMERGWLALVVMLVCFTVYGCDDNGERSGTFEPLADEAMIVESVLCLDVDEGGRPVGITDTFLESDERVYIWIFWTNIEDRADVEVVWFEPDSDVPFFEERIESDSFGGTSVTWFSIDRPSDGFVEGEWSVDIYLEGIFERSYLFIIE